MLADTVEVMLPSEFDAVPLAPNQFHDTKLLPFALIALALPAV